MTTKIILQQNEIDAYTIDDFKKNSKGFSKAIYDHIKFLLETGIGEEEIPGFREAVEEAEANKTPWFTHEYIKDSCLHSILQDIRNNKLFFDADGVTLPIYSQQVENSDSWEHFLEIGNQFIPIKIKKKED